MKYLKWIKDNEPVRTFLYTALVVLVGAIVAKGWLSADLSLLIIAGLATVLGVPAVEAARAKVSPTRKVEEVVQARVNEALTEVATQVPQVNLQDLIEQAGAALNYTAKNWIDTQNRR